MRIVFGISIAAWATAIAIPVAAQAPITRFDGVYAGVSMTSTNTQRYCPQPQRPAPGALTIANGVARTPWGAGGELVGSVAADGTLVMRESGTQNRFDGRADGQNVRGGATFGGAARVPCVWNLAWLRQR